MSMPRSKGKALPKKEQKDQDSWIMRVRTHLIPPSLKDNTADAERLTKGLKKALHHRDVIIDFSLLNCLTSRLRENHYQVDALVFETGKRWHVMDILPASGDKRLFGLALDLGTSTVVLQLQDITEKKIIDEISFENPQIEVGSDILSRIQFAAQEGGLQRLQKALIDSINRGIDRLSGSLGKTTDAIVGMSVAGNTVMTHFFLGLDPYWICREPYIPVVNKPGILRAEELGLAIHPRAPVLVFPNVGSYFGGDLVAGILASGITQQESISMLVDVGTNAEVVLGNREWIMGCAGAAGPALEGGVAKMGMMAGPGAIDRVKINPVSGEVQTRTIGNGRPVGICGSGLIDLAAQLFLAGMIDPRGKFIAEMCRNRLREIDGIGHFVVSSSRESATGKDLTLSQPDIDSLIRSKAAMYTILTTIARMVPISFPDIEKFYISGTFGAYIDPRSAITLGMIPDLPLSVYKSLGNTSVKGAADALLSLKARDKIEDIRDRITYIELNVNQEFMNLFSAAKFIPHTDLSLFPSVKGPASGRP